MPKRRPIQRHLENAPIAEALVDIRVKIPQNVDLSVFDGEYKLFRDEYPQREERIRIEARLDYKTKEGRVESTSTQVVDGYVYRSTNNKHVVQFRLDGFTFSRLKPYETWENLRDAALRFWERYLRAARPEIITRVALRYINRLELPFPVNDFREYLVESPKTPQGLPQQLSKFISRVVFYDANFNANAIITQSFDGVREQNIVPIILDIDVFKETQFSADGKAAWNELEELRNFKNEIFFKSITQKTVELCQ